MLADRERDYQSQGRLLYIAVGCFIAAVIGLVIVSLAAAWTLSKERDHPFVMVENPATGMRTLIAPAGPVASKEGRQAAIDLYLRQAFVITGDLTYNRNQRKAAIRKMHAPKIEKDKYEKIAFADLEKNKGFIHTVERLQFYPPSVPDPSGLHMDVDLTLKIEDMRTGGSSRDAVRFETYRIPIIMHEITPWWGNPFGLAFTPAKPTQIKDKDDVAAR
jgi:hypothetical protein